MPTVGVSWTSADPAKVTVSPSGQATALARGTVTLTASAGGVSGTTTVTVIGVQTVAIAPDSVGVIVAEQQTLAAVVTADPGVTVAPTWTVRDTLVATIESTGRVTARMVGVTWAVASAEVARDSVRVQVLPVPVLPPAAGSTTPVVTSVLGGAVALTIPPGATSVPALAVAPVTTTPADDRMPKALAYTFGPAGTQFATPITVGLRFDPSTIPVRKRAALELRLFEGGAAVPVPGSAVDLAGNRVTAPVSHFSTYGIFVPTDPSQVGVDAGGGQIQFVNYEVPVAPAVLVRDAQGRPVAGVLVRFDVSAGGGFLRGGLTATRDTATTNAGGVATLRAPWKLGGTAGEQTLTATAFRIGNDSTVASTTLSATAMANPVARVVLTPGDTTLRIGTSLSYDVKVFDMRDTVLTGRTVTWTTSDSTKATVSSTGLVTARAAGSATITATSEGKTASAMVTVQMPVATVEVSPATATLYPPAIATALNLPGAASQQLTATVKDAGGAVLAGRTVTWISSDTSMARVSATGLVSTVAVGSVTITAMSEGKSASATLTIVIPVTTVEVTPSTATLVVGVTQQLTAVTKDATGAVLSGRTVTWTTSDSTKATVSSTGLVTARAAGSATITASSEGKIGNTSVEVRLESGLRAYYPLDGSALDASGSAQHGTVSGAVPTTDRFGRANRAYRFNGGTNEIALGDINLTGAYSLSGWFRRTSTTSGGSAIVSRFFVDNSKGWEFYTPLNGGCLVFHSRGTAGPTATCSQTLEAGRWYHAAVVFDGVSKGTIYIDGIAVTERTGMLPDLAFTGYAAKIGRTAWGSDALVGDIDEVRIYERALTAAEVATLASDRPPVSSVEVTPATVTLAVGATQQLTAVTKDATGAVLSGRTVTWTTSDSTKATVSSTGMVTARAVGSATATATSEGKSGTVAITAQAPVNSIEIIPSPVSVVLGTPQQLSAILKDASGNVLSGRTVLWSSSNTGIVDISTSGLVTANDAGIATVTATSEGRSATVQVTATGVAFDVALSGPTGTGFYLLHIFGGSLTADRWERVVRTATTTTHRVLLPAPGSYQVRVYAIDARTDPLQTLGGWTRMLGATRQNAIALSEGVTRREIRATGVSVESVVAPTNVAMFEQSDISWVVRDSSGLVFEFPTRHLNHATSTWPDVGCGETICGGLGPNPIIPVVTVVDGQRRSYAASIPGQTTAGVRYWRVLHALETPVGRIALFSPSTVAGENLRELIVGASSTQLKVSVAANGLRAGTAILRISGDRLAAPVWTISSFNSQGIATFTQGLPSAGTYNVTALGLDSRTNPSQTLGSWARLVGLRRFNGFGAIGLDTTRISIALDGVAVTDLSAPVEVTVGVPIPISWTVSDTTGIIGELFSREVNWGSEIWPDVGCNAYFCGGNSPNTAYAGSPVLLSDGRLRYTATIPAQSAPSSLFLKIKHMTGLSLMDGNAGAIPAIFSPSTVNDEAPRIIKIVPAPVASITVSPTSTTLAIGSTQQLTATLKDGEGVTLTGRAVTWSSSDTSKVTVSNTGLVTGRSAGSATVTATSEGKTASAALTIFSPVIQKSTISVGVVHACGLSTTGAAYCWGRNNNGQLGDGTQIDRSTPTPVSGGLTFQAIAAGNYFTCGLTPAGSAYCWGWNELGQLGNGSLTSKFTPTAVSGGLIFKAIAAAEGGHACGLTTAGAAYCWGDNSYGQFGDGGYTSTSSPKLVSGGLTFQAIAAGRNHTCGLTMTGAAFCWGVNSDGNGTGRLGNGTRDDKAIPTAVSGGLTFQVITTAAFHTCGITTAGAAYCWGSNYHGEIGDGTRTDRWNPTTVFGELTFKSITALGIHTCGLTTAGAAVCWGENAYGELGDGTAATARLTPTVVSGGLTFQAITAGAGSTCGVTVAQSAFCWGVNSYGQLGDGSKSNRTVPTAVSGGLTFKSP